MKKQTKRGFTLIELLVVVLIIGILAAVAVPQYQKAVIKSRFATLKNLVHSIAQAEELYYLENGTYTDKWADLSVGLEKNKISEDVNCSLSLSERPEGGINAGVNCLLLTNPIQYSLHFNHSDYKPGERRCTVRSTTDTSDWRNTICQAETGRQNGITVESNNYIYYVY